MKLIIKKKCAFVGLSDVCGFNYSTSFVTQGKFIATFYVNLHEVRK